MQSKSDYLCNFSQEIAFHTKDYLDGKSSYTYDLKSITASFEIVDFEVRSNEYDNFKLRELVFGSALSKKVLIYTPFMVVNKTGLNLIIGNGKKRNDLEVNEYTSEYFNPKEVKKILIKTESYSWTKEFDITTVGVSGLLSLQKTKGEKLLKSHLKQYNSDELDIGVNISQLSSTFYKTIAVTFSPRYVI